MLLLSEMTSHLKEFRFLILCSTNESSYYSLEMHVGPASLSTSMYTPRPPEPSLSNASTFRHPTALSDHNLSLTYSDMRLT